MARSTGSWSERPGRPQPTPPGAGGAAASGSVTRVYLDYAGFAPVDPRVVAFMRPFLEGGIGNPSALHSVGSEAAASLEAARGKVARLFGGSPAGVIFTASATEASNLAIRGVLLRAEERRHLVTSAIEHVSVVNSCRDLEKRGYPVSWISVDEMGRVDPEAVVSAVRPDTALVSIGAANGEIGTAQPVREIGRLLQRRGVPFHVDAVGAAGRVSLEVDDAGIDLLTVSSNDLYGPPGAGALWVRAPAVKLAPMIVGGAQERGLRAGTENLPAIVGMGVAADLARVEGIRESGRLVALRDRLIRRLLETLPGARLTGALGRERLPHHVSVVQREVKADGVLLDLDGRGIAASTGSACMAKTGMPSHVLRAIGCDQRESEGSLCFTFGRWTTAAEIDTLLDALPPIVDRLRRLAPTA
jgi:cysteine desulfurase